MKYAGFNTGSAVYRRATDNSARPFQARRHYSVKRAWWGFYFDMIHSLDRNSIFYTTVHPLSLLPLHSTS
jgi:hypothetical protein